MFFGFTEPGVEYTNYLVGGEHCQLITIESVHMAFGNYKHVLNYIMHLNVKSNRNAMQYNYVCIFVLWKALWNISRLYFTDNKTMIS